MPIFLSYSHSDKGFVDRLATQLVAHRVSVWLDKWEIHAGDSLITKVQNAISGASALLVILSKASVKSEWCIKELNAGLMRELDEKRVVVVPVMVEECEMPAFLREKMYADFRKNFDDGLNTVIESIAHVTNANQGRFEELKYHTDWAIDWGNVHERDMFRVTMIDHTKEQPYTILSEVTMVGDVTASEWYSTQVAKGTDETAREEILLALEAASQGDVRFTFLLTDQMPMHRFFDFDLHGGAFRTTIIVRRLGMDTGRDIIIRVDDQLKNIGETIRAISARSEPNSKGRSSERRSTAKNKSTKKSGSSSTSKKRSTSKKESKS